MKPVALGILGILFIIVLIGGAQAATYQVGAGKTYANLQAVADLLNPGDVVIVDGNATYPANVYIDRSGNSGGWITIQGNKGTNNSRPVVTGSGSYGINISGDYVLLEGFEINGGPKGIGVFGNNIRVRDCVIHGCNHGLIGYGTGTGNVTVEYCEFYGNGVPTGGATQHQIYMATDEIAHPGAIFRLQYCYLHDGVEGDNVKSRSERNEIYYNWIELAGTSGHGLGLFAPDPGDNDQVHVNTAREDADVVGNVIIQSRNACARVGGDTPDFPTNGRYRFVNNTFVCTGSRVDAIRTFDTIETLEMYNNVVFSTASGADIRVINDADGAWVHSPRSLTGGNNWVVTGATMLPSAGEWTNTTRGSASPFVNAGVKDFHPAPAGPLVNAGASAAPTVAAYPFVNPLFPPAFQPPQAKLIDTGAAEVRPVNGVIDIGAFEMGQASVGSTWAVNRNRKVNAAAARAYQINGRLIRGIAWRGSGLCITGEKGKNFFCRPRP